jgi:hypothetical protein
MFLNVVELMDSVITDARTLLDELGQNEKTRQRIDSLLNAAQAIRTELMQYASADGSIDNVPRSSGYYTRTPFAVFETGIYLSKKLAERGIFPLDNQQLECLERMDSKVKSVRERLDDIWGTG